MGLEKELKTYEVLEPDGGLYTQRPAHVLKKNQSPTLQNTDPTYNGGVKKRLGHIKFTGSAKVSPTGTFVSGLFSGTSAAGGAIKAWQVDASPLTFVDETTDFNSSAAGDVDPFPAVEAVGDYFAIGCRVKYSGLTIIISTAGVGGTVAWEYWNGSAWTALSGVTDGTTGFTASAGSTTYKVYWTIPSDWATVSLNSVTLYYVRARVTGTYGTNPVLSSGSLFGVPYTLAAEGSTVQDISDGTWNTPITGLTITVDKMVRMFMSNDKIIILNEGGGPFYTTDGVSSSSLGGSPPSKAQFGMVHRNRVFLGTGANSVATHSALLNEEDYTTSDNAGSLTFSKNDGMVLNGMCSGVDFAIFSKISPASGGKEGNLYILFGSSPFDWSARKILNVGAVSHEAMLAYDNFVVVATNRGIYGIQGRYPYKLSEPIQQTYLAISSKSSIAIGRYQTKLYFGYPTSSANNRELVVDVERSSWTMNTGKTPRVYANHPDGRMLFGTSGTSILVWEAENGNNDDGSAIDFIYETPDMTFDERWCPATLRWAYLHADTGTSSTLTATHYADGTVTSYSDTMAVSSEGPIKKLKNFLGNRATFHRVRLRDNSTNGQTIVYGLKVTAKAHEPGTQRSA